MGRKIKIGIRPSKLAEAQLYEILHVFKDIDIEIVKIKTTGDIDKLTPIEYAKDDFFTDGIDEKLIKKEIDIAVHSAKDLPINYIEVFEKYFTKPFDSTDSIITNDDYNIFNLPKHSVIGASSRRRKNLIRKIRKDLKIKDLRGNIEERIDKLYKKQYNGIILASCALKRLNLIEKVKAFEIPKEIFPTHPFQGSLAIVFLKENNFIKEIIQENEKKGIFYRSRAW